MQILRIINPDKVSDEVAHTYKPRSASRGVVFDSNNKVAILHVSKYQYYKLPGGGIEEGEDRIAAFRRECMEEIGSDVEVISEVGKIIEYRAGYSVIQTSYCYIGKIVGDRKETTLTEREMTQGFEQPVWVDITEALKLVSGSATDDYGGKLIKERDTLILETAMKGL